MNLRLQPDALPAAGEKSARVSAMLQMLLFGAAYMAAAELGHWLSVQGGAFATIWPPAGVYLAALLLTPRKQWPLMIGAAVAANLASDTLLHGQDISLSLGFCALNTLSAATIAALLQRFSSGFSQLETIRGVFAFAILSLAVEIVLSAPLGAALVEWKYGKAFWLTWSRWWLADVGGIWLTAPLVLVAVRKPSRLAELESPLRILEAVLLFVSLAAVSYGVYFYRLGWFSIPILPTLWVLWAALRFGSAGVGIGMFIVAVSAARGTALTVGAFVAATRSPDEAVLRLLIYLGVWFLIFHMIAAVLHERYEVMEKLSGTNVLLEQRVAERTAALTAANEALRTAKDTAESASSAKDDFLAALSHELRTPLTPVLLVASAAQRNRELPPAVRDDFAMIQRNVMLEARLIDDLLDLTRIVRGHVDLAWEEVDLHSLIQRILEGVQTELEEKSLQLSVEWAAVQPTIRGDPIRLQQVFRNLLTNAMKFTPAGGRITIRTSVPSAGRLVIEFSDTGVGIIPEELQRIFAKFEQGELGRQFGGLGLGLAISRTLVELHGGQISAASAGRGQGASFHVELPLVAKAAGEIAVDAGGAAPPRRVLEILLVEDHEATRKTLSRLLERRGHRVTAAGDLAAARQFALAHHYDLLLSDLDLPDGDGCMLMRELAAAGGPPGIAFSGLGMEEDLRRSIAAGFRQHLTKPLDFQTLARVIESETETDRPGPASEGAPA